MESLIEKNKDHLALIELWGIVEQSLMDLHRARKRTMKTANTDYEWEGASTANDGILEETMEIYSRHRDEFDMRKYQHWSQVRNKLIHGDTRFSKESIVDGILYTINMMRLFDSIGEDGFS